MSDTNLLVAHQPTQELINGSLVHVDSKQSEENAFVASHDNVAEAQKITALQSGNDWYQKDLSHMTTNLMRAEMNTTALTQTVAISPTSLIIDGMNAANPGVDYGGWNIKWQSMTPSKYGPGDYHAKPEFVRIETGVAHDRANVILMMCMVEPLILKS